MEDAMNSFITLVNDNHVVDCPSYDFGDCDYQSSDDYYAYFQGTTAFGCNNNNNGSTCFKEMLRRLTHSCREACATGDYYSEVGFANINGYPYFWGPTPGTVQACSSNWLFYQPNAPSQYCLDENGMTCYTNGAYLGAIYYRPYISGSATEKKCVVAYQFWEAYSLCSCASGHRCIPIYGKRQKYIQ